ncbi:hypothetical protein WR25_13518 [Diploscapter pachys]|uniref:Uncharacterized protein n=1 Tax=Diploscapter pachys TaxID=2018661 RepID=A0A2A2JVX5_9BILA|nr:hypothetical protein WR25_13518 [Diploscapter pachys]
MMATRAFRVVMMPAFAIEMVCCSMTSVLSLSTILSNSSMQQTPLSANTRAPPSRVISPVRESFTTAAVRPTPGKATNGTFTSFDDRQTRRSPSSGVL